jgi:hypothetical protein
MMLTRHKDAGKTTGDSFRQQHEAWRWAYAEAPRMQERFPKVEELVFDMVFTDVKKMGRYSPQMRSFSASAKAFFAIACPRTLCLDGGFNLDPILLAMLGTGATTSSGILECGGWVKTTPTENARCLLQMHYRLQARYDAPRRALETNARRSKPNFGSPIRR